TGAAPPQHVAEGWEEAPGWDEIALPQPSRPEQRLVIKNASVTIVADPPEDGPPKVVEIARRLGGYVQTSSRTSIVIRVPATAFEETLDALGEIGRVVERTVSGEDVSEQYYDLNIRLRNALAARQRYLALLEQARTVQEALLVERELERITLQIEEFRGRLRYLRDRISDSTIRIGFVGEYDEPTEVRPGPIGWIFYGLYKGIRWLFVWD
ncbi:MAG: DUF4349 domain-containing protein, partial [Myxococcota bacterium]|nr:DUF4349 domain-containing protein [Myxococcota bacterium]